MRFLSSSATVVLLGTIAQGAYLKNSNAQIIDARQVQASYDYIVVGGGHSGTVVAARLSEDPTVSVLLIEAGTTDADEDFVHLPKNAGGAMGTKYDWAYKSVAMSSVNNRVVTIPAGKVIGGGTVLNGMAFDRGAASDYDAWVDLGNEGWGWDDLLPYFKKSETFTPPEEPFASEFNITYDMSVHGTDGPIYASYPRHFNPTLKNWFRGLSSLGVHMELDGASGRALNAFWAPNALHPTNMTRSYAKNGYYDPALKRSNFHVLLNRQVTKLVGSGSPVTITGVQHAAGASQAATTVTANKEVIVAAGAVGSPKILQLSGIGPAALLQRHNIPVLVDLPGVGSNYQDHGYLMTFNQLQNAPAAIDDATAQRQWQQSRSGPWTNSGPNAFVFAPMSKITSSSRAASLLAQINAQTPAQYLRSGTPQAVVDGFAKQKDILAKRLATADMAGVELVFSGGSIMCSQQHPFSRGYVEISSADAFAAPTLDLRYVANPLDLDYTIDAIKFSRNVMATAPLQELRPQEFSPGASTTSDDALKTWVKGQISTMFHSCCTNPMQPRNLGGVVDPKGLVYGTTNLRIVDASIIPLIPGTHPQSTVYAVAEKIADEIKKAAGNPISSSTTSQPSTSTTTTTTPTTIPTTVRPTTATTTTPTTTYTPPAPTPTCTVAKWGQCNGNGYSGCKTCVSGTTCNKLNDWYSQCL